MGFDRYHRDLIWIFTLVTERCWAVSIVGKRTHILCSSEGSLVEIYVEETLTFLGFICKEVGNHFIQKSTIFSFTAGRSAFSAIKGRMFCENIAQKIKLFFAFLLTKSFYIQMKRKKHFFFFFFEKSHFSITLLRRCGVTQRWDESTIEFGSNYDWTKINSTENTWQITALNSQNNLPGTSNEH